MKQKVLLALSLVCSFLILETSASSAAGYASCVAVTDARIETKYGDLVYTLSLTDLCESGVRSYSLTLRSNKITVSDVYESYVNIPSYGTEVSFSLSKYSPGSYAPSLEISSSKDRERRTISLPRFNIESPIDCLEVTQSGLDSSQSSYSVMLKNSCDSLDSYAFQNLKVELQGMENFGFYSNVQGLNSLSNFGTSIRFNLSGLGSGTYFPALRVSDFESGKSRILYLSSFTLKNVQSQPTPKAKVSTKELCVTGKDYTKECFSFPNFTYTICSISPSGKVQYQSGGKWLFAWNFKGTKDLEQCKSNFPFLITISGTSESTRNMRLLFNKYQNSQSFYSYFKVTVS